LRKRIIEASEDDDYAKDDMSRKNAMKNFKGLVKNYDFNNPVDVSTINIFQESDEVEEDISEATRETFYPARTLNADIFCLFNSKLLH
jgi:hypothetical protein